MEISAYFLSMKRNCSMNSIELPLVWYFTGATAYMYQLLGDAGCCLQRSDVAWGVWHF